MMMDLQAWSKPRPQTLLSGGLPTELSGAGDQTSLTYKFFPGYLKKYFISQWQILSPSRINLSVPRSILVSAPNVLNMMGVNTNMMDQTGILLPESPVRCSTKWAIWHPWSNQSDHHILYSYAWENQQTKIVF